MSILQRLPTTQLVKVPALGIEVIVKPISIQQFLDLAKNPNQTDDATIDLILNHIVDCGTKEELLAQSPAVFMALLEAIKEGSGVADHQLDAKKKS